MPRVVCGMLYFVMYCRLPARVLLHLSHSLSPSMVKVITLTVLQLTKGIPMTSCLATGSVWLPYIVCTVGLVRLCDSH